MTDDVLALDQLTRDQTAVWRAVTDLYASYLDGDRQRLESHLAPDCTMWESARPELRTKSDMVRARESGATGHRLCTTHAGRPAAGDLGGG